LRRLSAGPQQLSAPCVERPRLLRSRAFDVSRPGTTAGERRARALRGTAGGRPSARAAGGAAADTAVTPQYVHGLAAERELPIIRRIAVGSLRNKLLIILPAIMLLRQFLPR